MQWHVGSLRHQNILLRRRTSTSRKYVYRIGRSNKKRVSRACIIIKSITVKISDINNFKAEFEKLQKATKTKRRWVTMRYACTDIYVQLSSNRRCIARYYNGNCFVMMTSLRVFASLSVWAVCDEMVFRFANVAPLRHGPIRTTRSDVCPILTAVVAPEIK